MKAISSVRGRSKQQQSARVSNRRCRRCMEKKRSWSGVREKTDVCEMRRVGAEGGAKINQSLDRLGKEG